MKTTYAEDVKREVAEAEQAIRRYQALLDSVSSRQPGKLDILAKGAKIAYLKFIRGYHGPLGFFQEQVSTGRHNIPSLKSAESNLGQLIRDIDSAQRLLPSD